MGEETRRRGLRPSSPWSGRRGETLLFAALLWLCTLPLIGLGVAPLLGGGIALLLALGLLPVCVVLCGRLLVTPVAARATRDMSRNRRSRGMNGKR